jgi:hypothetical protein
MVPHTQVRFALTVLADTDWLRINDNREIVATHPRSYDKGAQIEIQAHIQALVETKRAARRHRATDRLAQAAPASRTFLTGAAERGHNLGNITATLLQLLERYGASQLDAAIVEALERNAASPRFAWRRTSPAIAASTACRDHPAARRASARQGRAAAFLDTHDKLKKAGHETPDARSARQSPHPRPGSLAGATPPAGPNR